ncbi:hypothetical protein BN1708_016267 [Verticillium longisporum]|uniref:Acyl-CoA dehydrogenase/oxidase C-terminal domain-containing protein n=1 Tax=Verticillium longisporum TaxID=100787 RepID=A0A0G4MHJ9_VERLO|nr:hypothetical protein BN1708_016267 [Verticillium longisporum]
MPFVQVTQIQFKELVVDEEVKSICDGALALKASCLHPTTGQPLIKSITGGIDQSTEGRQHHPSAAHHPRIDDWNDSSSSIKLFISLSAAITMAQPHPTLINLPPPGSNPDTPSEMPGTPTSTTTSMSALSTTAIKDGQRGHLPHGHTDRGHTHNPSTQSLEAERADRISRLAGLERVSTLRASGQQQLAGGVNSLSPQTASTSTYGFPPNNPNPTPAYFDAQGQPTAATKMSTPRAIATRICRVRTQIIEVRAPSPALVNPNTVPPEKWDLFHELILTDELSRPGSGGFVWNIIGGFGIGCPPLVKFGQKALVDRILPGILAGDERICLAITEPDAGSDVANLSCEAKLTEDGKHFIVNGEKKWITNGKWARYFTTAVRTGEPGMNGVSLLLIERDFPGVTTRQMDCQGVWSSGTTYITFEDVKVPVENLLGKKDRGFRAIMTNFNHERIGIIIQCLRFSRVCYSESVSYASKRRTFGKKLIEHPVIRLKLAHMARQIEASYNWLENLMFQCQKMGETEAMLKLGGAIAGLKAQSTVTFEFCAREASQIFGGLSYSRGGQGGKVERLYRDVRAYAIPGGSEEIMLDLSIRQSMRVNKALGMKL